MGQKAEEIIRKVNGTMAMEGMPLTEDDKAMLRRCIDGISTPEQEIAMIINQYSENK
ncbi:antitoxin VbhA family protein [Amedibacillus sp. YH-ame6]